MESQSAVAPVADALAARIVDPTDYPSLRDEWVRAAMEAQADAYRRGIEQGRAEQSRQQPKSYFDGTRDGYRAAIEDARSVGHSRTADELTLAYLARWPSD